MNLTTAAGALRRLPPFENVSLRLLQDLIEFASLEEPDEANRVRTGGAPPGEQKLWFVSRGVVEVEREGEVPRRVGPGRFYVSRRGDHKIRPGPEQKRFVRVREFRRDWFEEALRASFTLARTVSQDAWEQLLGFSVPPEYRRAHRILLTRDPRFEAPVEALAHLLVAAIAVQFGEPAAVVRVEQTGVSIRGWRDGELVEVKLLKELDVTEMSTEEVLEAVWRALERALGHAEGIHLIFVHLADPLRLPKWWSLYFHRIVYVTDRWEVSSTAPPELLAQLFTEAWDPDDPRQGPFFSSFIPTVIVAPARASRWSVRRALPCPLGPGLRDLVDIGIADESDFTTRPEPIEARFRLFRDLCRMRLELRDLSASWSEHADKRRFAAAALGDVAVKATVERWARAVTNRQVGVAMSGGGAVNALLVPIIQKIVRRVPIDVVSGVSGGALVGAYLCHDNPGGLRAFRGEGLTFQLGFIFTMMTSAALQQVLDWLLDAPRVEELETRLVAVTTELQSSGVPRPRAVVKGTVGQAVRVSGAAPGLFGPADRGDSRFIDGAATLAVPARVLADFGADIAFAFNAVGPVRERNLLRAFALPGLGKAIADVVYYLPFVGRQVDGVTTQFALLQQASQAAAEEVDVFYEVPPESIPVMRGFYWACIDALARAVERQEDRWRPVCDRCVDRWTRFRQAAQA